MDLHPCSCGSAGFDVRHTLQYGDDGALIAVYTGWCDKCGLPRRFEFALDPQTPPPPPAFGGPNASTIICPGQFALLADEEAASAPLEPDPSAADRRAAGRASIARALAAQEEIIKLVPPGSTAVPASAFTSDDGRVLYQRDPARFDADRLTAVADTYRDILARYDS